MALHSFRTKIVVLVALIMVNVSTANIASAAPNVMEIVVRAIREALLLRVLVLLRRSVLSTWTPSMVCVLLLVEYSLLGDLARLADCKRVLTYSCVRGTL